MELYAGLDLHSRNTYIGIMDKEFKRVFGKRVSNNLPLILKILDPFQNQLGRNCRRIHFQLVLANRRSDGCRISVCSSG